MTVTLLGCRRSSTGNDDGSVDFDVSGVTVYVSEWYVLALIVTMNHWEADLGMSHWCVLIMGTADVGADGVARYHCLPVPASGSASDGFGVCVSDSMAADGSETH